MIVLTVAVQLESVKLGISKNWAPTFTWCLFGLNRNFKVTRMLKLFVNKTFTVYTLISLLFMIMIALIIGCVNENKSSKELPGNEINSLNTQIIKVRNDDILESNINLSDLIDSVEFVVLETNENNQISQIDKVIDFRNRFYILDRISGRRVLVFDHKGKFLFQIGRNGKGPGEYIIPYDISIDEAGNNLYLIDVQNRRINIYDALTGSFKESLSHDLPISQLIKQGSRYVTLVGKQMERLVITDDKLNLIDKSIKFEPRYAMRVYDPLVKVSDSLTIFRLFLNDTIYGVSEGKLFPFMIIDFGNYGVGNSDLDFSLDQMRGIDYRKHFSNKMTSKTKFYYGKTHTFFTFLYREDLHWVVVSNDKGGKVVVSTRNIENDVTFEYEPPFIKGISEDRESYICFLFHHKLDQKRLTGMNLTLESQHLKRIMDSDFNENSNPMIVKINFKDNFPVREKK